MAKVVLDDVGSGYQTATKQNANNDTIETHLNDRVLYRDNPAGEANTMQQELDMNSNQITNVTNPNNAQDAATKAYTDSLLSGTTDAGSAQLRLDLADTANGEGASLVGIEDSAGDFTATTVEGALAELVTESVALAGTQTITGDKTFSGTTLLTGSLEVDGTTQLDGAVTINATVAATEDVTLSKTLKQVKGTDVASALALSLGDGNYFDVTGTTTITSINTKGIGTVVRLHFDAALVLTHHTTDLILPGAANITTAAGDEAEFIEYASGDWRCLSYQAASAAPILAYAVGTWTPTLLDSSLSASEGQTYTNQVGKYTKIGDTVFIDGRIDMSSLGTLTGADIAYIGGLPFTVGSDIADIGAVTIGFGTNLSITAGTAITGIFSTGNNEIIMKVWDAIDGNNNVTITNISADGVISFSGHYNI